MLAGAATRPAGGAALLDDGAELLRLAGGESAGREELRVASNARPAVLAEAVAADWIADAVRAYRRFAWLMWGVALAVSAASAGLSVALAEPDQLLVAQRAHLRQWAHLRLPSHGPQQRPGRSHGARVAVRVRVVEQDQTES